MPNPAFGLSLDDFGRLVLIDDDGVRHVGVEPVRAFPLTEPDRWIALVEGSGREVAMVEDPAELAPHVRTLLLEELARREFLPRITRIVGVSGDTPPHEWRVETDRGPTQFLLDSDDQIRRLGGDRLLVADARGQRYEILEASALDGPSRRILERYL